MVARKEKLRRVDLKFRWLLDEHQKTTPSPHFESEDIPASQSKSELSIPAKKLGLDASACTKLFQELRGVTDDSKSTQQPVSTKKVEGTLATTLDGKFIIVDKSSITTL